MQKLFRLVGLAAFGIGIASCAGGALPSSQAFAPASPLTGAARDHSRHSGPNISPAWDWSAGVFVTDSGNQNVRAFKHCGTGGLVCPSQTFTFNNGISYPIGIWADDPHYLYVANSYPASVTQYKHNNPSVAFTYTSGLASPDDVTTDHAHNVYVTSGGAFYPTVNEYKQKHNVVMKQCPTGFYGASGVAVDSHDDVFVFENNVSNGVVVEFPGGLTGCNGITLPFTFSFFGEAANLALDNAGNLLVCDYSASTVYKISPPYTTLGTFVSGISGPISVRVNKANTEALVVDWSGTVHLLSYPGAAPLQQLGTSNGLQTPRSAVDWKNDVQ